MLTTEAPILLAAPHHVAIIMDGNRRWAKKSAASTFSGHWAGARVLLDIVRAASDLGVKVLTVYGFSTENWDRAPGEIETLFGIFESYLKENRQKMINEEIAFHIIGNIEPLPESLRDEIQITRDMTASGCKIDLVVALNYGGRDEVTRATRRLMQDALNGGWSIDQIDENMVSKYLDTAPFGDPDLLIRTSGELRISNFLLWQLAYTEIVVSDVLWPDFSPDDLKEAITIYQQRERRLGR